MKNTKLFSLVGAMTLVAAANAVLVDQRVDMDEQSSLFVADGLTSIGEYDMTSSYTGGGAGFGGTLGNGQVFMDFSANNLNVGVRLGGNLNDIVVLYIDSKAGGFTDAQMNDVSDGGRRAVSDLSRDNNDTWDPGFLPDYAIIFGGFGSVSFELQGGSAHNFLEFRNATHTLAGANSAEAAFTRSTLGLGSPTAGFRWNAFYVSGSGFMSNETIPVQAGNANGNTGFGTGATVNWDGYNEFAAVPEPGTMAVLGLGAAALLRRRAKKS